MSVLFGLISVLLFVTLSESVLTKPMQPLPVLYDQREVLQCPESNFNLYICGGDEENGKICCPEGDICCINPDTQEYQSCAPPYGSCCPDGHSCDVDFKCCGTACVPLDAECCGEGVGYCPELHCVEDGDTYVCSGTSTLTFSIMILFASILAFLLF